MITTEVSPRSTLPADFTADQARALLDQIAETFPTVGPLTSAQLAGALSLAWQAGYATARETPVCDFCGEAVVPFQDPHMSRPLWTHKDTMVFGCQGEGFYPGGSYAQVRGGGAPEDTAALDAKMHAATTPAPEPTPRYGDESACPRCGERVVYLGRGRYEHCETGYSGQISCYS